ncbi:MAG: lysophospholipid acyltransferase [Piccolia ochrophora]|nr:MAG: lysophospholipid acyltransferase [Piccolia ochrophora]
MLPYINYPFEYVGGALGASADELKLIGTFLLSVPLAGGLKRIPDSRPDTKNLYIIAVSLFFLVGLFDLWSGIRTILISSVGAYVIAASIDGPFMPWIAFVFLMGHMSINHVNRQTRDSPSTVDITGPSFDFVEYRKWIDTTMFDIPPNIDPSKRPPTRQKRKIPRSGTRANLTALSGILWVMVFVKLSAWYPAELLLGPDYMKYGLLRRIWILHMFGFTARTKYYGVWGITEGSCILVGVGYRGVDPQTGQVNWGGPQNVDAWAVESAQNSRGYLEGWNISTNHWLRNYVYLRVTPRGKKPGFRASMATFVTSAIWHGFYPGYYLAFVLASFIQTVAKNFRRHVRPFFLAPNGSPLPSKRYYDILSYLATQAAFSFTVAPFVLLGFRASLTVWARVYFYCPIGVALSVALFASPAKPYIMKRLQQRNQGRVAAAPGFDGKLPRTMSQDSMGPPALGLPNDPGRDFDEVFREVKEEVETRRRRGSKVSVEEVKRNMGL